MQIEYLRDYSIDKTNNFEPKNTCRNMVRYILKDELRTKLCWAGNVRTGKAAFEVFEEIRKSVIEAAKRRDQVITEEIYKTTCQYVFNHPNVH